MVKFKLISNSNSKATCYHTGYNGQKYFTKSSCFYKWESKEGQVLTYDKSSKSSVKLNNVSIVDIYPEFWDLFSKLETEYLKDKERAFGKTLADLKKLIVLTAETLINGVK